MKHLLIIFISILLLSCPLFGQSKKKDLLYIWENGSRYVGEWKDGKKHGHGKDIGVLHLTGYWSEGEWKDDQQWNITNYDKDGKVHSKVENGKVKDLENGEHQK